MSWLNRKTFAVKSIPLVMACALAACARAGGLDRTRVDHDAAWVLHVDMERLRESPLGAGALSDRSEFPGAMFHDLRTDLGLDPGSDINAVTVYGMPRSAACAPSDSVVLVSATSAADGLPAFMRDAHPDSFEVSQEGRATLYSWTVDESRWFLSVRTPTDQSERLVVMSRTRERMASALAVLDDARPDLVLVSDPSAVGARSWPFDQDPAKDSMVFVLASRAMWGGKDACSPAFQGTHGAVVDLREQKDETGARWARLTGVMRMESEQSAEQMVKIVRGAMSWLSLAAGDVPGTEDCRKALDGCQPTRDGGEVVLDVKVNARQLAAVLDTAPAPRFPNKNHTLTIQTTSAREKGSSTPENGDTDQAPPAKNPLSTTPPRR